MHGLEAEYFGRIRFSYLDADDPAAMDFQRALGFHHQPEFYLLDPDGTVLMKWVGYVSRDAFELAFAEYLT